MNSSKYSQTINIKAGEKRRRLDSLVKELTTKQPVLDMPQSIAIKSPANGTKVAFVYEYEKSGWKHVQIEEWTPQQTFSNTITPRQLSVEDIDADSTESPTNIGSSPLRR
jgi:hypothetical protein